MHSSAEGVEGTRRPPTGSQVRQGGWAFAPGPRGAAPIAGVVLLAVAVALVWIFAGGGASASRRPAASPAKAAAAKYGGLPSWLPKPKVKVGRVLSASVAHPAFSVEGESVRASVAGGSVLATAVGPEVPEEGHFPVPEVTPTVFIVTFASATRTIPLRAAAFALYDERGHVHHPRVTALGGGAPPREIAPGRPVSIKLHAVLPTGNGAVAWTPEGSHVLASWDFSVEID